jgi:hypothetical protein
MRLLQEKKVERRSPEPESAPDTGTAGSGRLRAFRRGEAMGEKMAHIFELVTEQAGLRGRLELAGKTGISLKEALAVRDSEELLAKLRVAANEILNRKA